eukprot:CAMPEP_0177649266 /NCGR_PEP_ID=MMETSP0447-20121125/11288_1 /TAXON_ID=0 /ORGANISM="Stygamoeba regulata, Strain BSH-02190019" /LENGTH=116 /DNA_ID=CAMNT_0019151999 /DNA_START=75 /DNA_END=425 /DNA_ORIENTATION=-
MSGGGEKIEELWFETVEVPKRDEVVKSTWFKTTANDKAQVTWSFTADPKHRLYYKFTLYQDDDSNVISEGSFYGELTGGHEIEAEFVGTVTVDFLISNHSRLKAKEVQARVLHKLP